VPVAYSLTTPARGGTVIAGAAVSTSDTISRAVLGTKGVNLKIINGNAATNTVTISDSSTTTEGAPAASISATIAPSTSQVFKVVPAQLHPTNGVVTVTNSVTTTVTYEMTPRA
jgi:hypothetical protein